MIVYPRDHSCYQSRPGTTHGAHALHSPSAAESAIAACDRRILLNDTAGWHVDGAPIHLLCQRRGCVAARRQAIDAEIDAMTDEQVVDALLQSPSPETSI